MCMYYINFPTDCRGQKEVVDESRRMLKDLVHRKLPAALPSDNIMEYKLKWTEKGRQ